MHDSIFLLLLTLFLTGWAVYMHLQDGVPVRPEVTDLTH